MRTQKNVSSIFINKLTPCLYIFIYNVLRDVLKFYTKNFTLKYNSKKWLTFFKETFYRENVFYVIFASLVHLCVSRNLIKSQRQEQRIWRESYIGPLFSRSVLRNIPRLPLVSNRCGHNLDALAGKPIRRNRALAIGEFNWRLHDQKTHILLFRKFVIKLKNDFHIISFIESIIFFLYLSFAELSMLDTLNCNTYLFSDTTMKRDKIRE